MKAASIIVLTTLSSIMVILITICLLIHSLQSTILKPYSTSGYLSQSNLYPALAEIMKQKLVETITMQNDNSKRNVNQAVVHLIVSKTVDKFVSANWLNSKIDAFQTRWWDFMLNKTDHIAPFDLSDLKADSRIGALLTTVFPIVFDITKAYKIRKDQLQQLKARYQFIQQISVFLNRIILLLFLIGLAVSFYVGRLLRWTGITCLIAGAVMIAIFALIKEKNPFGQFQMAASSITFPSGVHEGLLKLALLLQIETAENVFRYAAVLIIAGLLCYLCTYLSFIKSLDLKMRKLTLNHAMIPLRAAAVMICLTGLVWQVYVLANNHLA